MSTGSRGRKLRIVCGTETSYGAGVSGGFGDAGDTSLANNGLRAVSSPNPVEPRQNFLDFLEHSDGYDEGDTVSGIRTVPFSFTQNFQGGTAVDGAPRFDPILLAAGMKKTVSASTSVTYDPVGQSDTPSSAVLAFELDNSWVWETRGAYVNVILRLTPRGGFQMEVRGEGKWLSAPTAGSFDTVYKSGWSGGTSQANKVGLSGTNRFKINNGGSDYFGVWKGLTIDLGWRWIQDDSMNDTNLLDCLLPDSPRQMRVTADLGLDNASGAAVPYSDFFEDADDGTTHDMAFEWQDRSGTTEWTFTMSNGRIIQSPRHSGDSRRVIQVQYKLRQASDFQMVQAAPA